MYLVDTNVISVLDWRRGLDAESLVAWLRRNEGALAISCITQTEMEIGRLKLKRLGRIERADEIADLLAFVDRRFASRILSVDSAVAIEAARLTEATRGHAVALPDLLIAATANVHGMTVLTRNLRHFRPTGIAALDPFEALPPDA